MSIDALKTAITNAGSQAALAEKIGVTQSLVSYWLKSKKGVAAECVIAIEEATGVSRHDLRPDLYPRSNNPASRNTKGRQFA